MIPFGIQQELLEHDQDHIMKAIEKADEKSRNNLINQLSGIDLDFVFNLFSGKMIYKKEIGNLTPPDIISSPKNIMDKRNQESAMRIGEQALSQGKAAIFLAAGGQGSRLGFDGPKGAFPITPVRKKTLFQVHAEKILALNNRYNTSLVWVIMTSPANHEETISFFEKHKYFGFDKDKLFFISQGMLPAITEQGKLVLKSPGSLFLSPNGHGGCIFALKESGMLDKFRELGIEHLFYFQVDNVLINIADPLFFGHHIKENADVSLKVLRKRNAKEKVGLVVNDNGKTVVVEYSDIPEEVESSRDHKGNLRFWAGSIGIHFFSVDFITRLLQEENPLPYHIARKKVKTINASDELIELDSIKYEMFIFDTLDFAQKVIVYEGVRELDFAPVKNAQGSDSPETARQAQIDLFNSWLKKAQSIVEKDAIVEISPLYASNLEELMDNIQPGTVFKKNTYLG